MAGKTTKRSKPEIKLNSYDDLFGDAPLQTDAVEVMIKDLYEFENHPFHVTDDEDMAELIQSIRDKGILVPLIVRSKEGGGYEIISGHRRKHAAEIAGLFKVPVLIREMPDEEAVDIMIYSNIQRTNILHSEKARAYRLQMETMKHQGKKGNLTSDAIGKKYGDNTRKVYRYIRLSYLHEDLLNLIDNGKMTIQAGYWLSFLNEQEQGWILKIFQQYRKLPSGRTAQQLKEHQEDHVLTLDRAETLILGNGYRRKVSLKSKRIDRIFPPEYDGEQIEEIIYELLERWKSEQE